MLALGQKASQGADQCARACSRGAAVSRKPPGGGGKGRAHKHAGGKKHHHQTVKHPPGHHKQPSHHGGGPAPPVVVKGHHHHHARGWSPGWDGDCCAAEAAGVLLGLSDAGVLALYEATPRDPDGYATIADTLCAAAQYGLAGHRPVFEEVMPLDAAELCTTGSRRRSDYLQLRGSYGRRAVVTGLSGVILGVALPEPHAMAVTPDGTWWSWGEPFDPCDWPELVVEEAWALCL